jgi:hypothetical protein
VITEGDTKFSSKSTGRRSSAKFGYARLAEAFEAPEQLMMGPATCAHKASLRLRLVATMPSWMRALTGSSLTRLRGYEQHFGWSTEQITVRLSGS